MPEGRGGNRNFLGTLLGPFREKTRHTSSPLSLTKRSGFRRSVQPLPGYPLRTPPPYRSCDLDPRFHRSVSLHPRLPGVTFRREFRLHSRRREHQTRPPRVPPRPATAGQPRARSRAGVLETQQRGRRHYPRVAGAAFSEARPPRACRPPRTSSGLVSSTREQIVATHADSGARFAFEPVADSVPTFGCP
jgi:hypothetical protein